MILKIMFGYLLIVGIVAKSIKNVTSDDKLVTVDMLDTWKRNMTELFTDMIDTRIKDNRKHVFFHAKMKQLDITLNKNSIVKFENVLNNEGNYFNAGDSVFISPVSGVYLFSWTVQGYPGKTDATELRVENVVKETIGMHLANNSRGSASRVIICKVGENDHVWIQTSDQSAENIFDTSYNAQSSFMGVLLYET